MDKTGPLQVVFLLFLFFSEWIPGEARGNTIYYIYDIILKYLARMLSEMRTLFYLRFFNLSSYLKSHFLVGVSCG